MYPASEIISVYAYKDIYDACYDVQRPDVIPPGKIIFCEACNLKEFFETLSKYPERKIILISCESDYGVCYQNEYWANKDVFKAYWRVKWNEIADDREHYINVNLSACDINRCCPTDKFSSKIDGMTACTFNEIPKNVVKWFCANSCINEPRVEFLPYGVNTYGDLSLFEEFHKKDRVINPKSLYINFDVNTYDRYQLKNFWREQKNDWATFVEEAKPVRDFYKDLINHDFILSPKGNGFDGFRNYECCYLGVIPICNNNACMMQLMDAGFPVIMVDNLSGLNKRLLDEIKIKIKENIGRINWSVLKKSYWFDKIHKAAKEI